VLDRLLNALRTNEPPGSANLAQLWRKQIAVAAILVEASQIDRHVTADETEVIVRATMHRLGMNEAETLRLVAEARTQFANSLDDWVYSEEVRSGYGYEDRVEIVKLLWEVVYADGKLSLLEAELMKRLGQQLNIEEADLTAARIEAFGRVSGQRARGEGFD